MNLQFDEEDREILARLVQREFSDVGPELRHTNTADYRDYLRDYRRKLKSLSERLSPESVKAH